VRAAKWDADAEIGGAWTATVQRLVALPSGTVALPLVAPSRLELWTRAADSATATPALTVDAVISGNAKWARLTITAEQLATLGVGTFEHRLTLGDPEAGPLVVARGWLVVRGRVEDP
jgi:hypothetical protein